MKHLYALLTIIAAIYTTASAQITKTEKDPQTGLEIKSAVVILVSGMGMQLNFFARGDEKLMEFVEGNVLEGWKPELLKKMSIVIKLKSDSAYRFPVDPSKYTLTNVNGFYRSSLVAVVTDKQLTPLLGTQIRSISLSFSDGKDTNIPAISDNNRREIKKAVAYVMGSKK